LRSRREITSEISMFDTEAKGYNVILSEAKNLGSFLDRVAHGNRQRCFAPLNMTKGLSSGF